MFDDWCDLVADTAAALLVIHAGDQLSCDAVWTAVCISFSRTARMTPTGSKQALDIALRKVWEVVSLPSPFGYKAIHCLFL